MRHPLASINGLPKEAITICNTRQACLVSFNVTVSINENVRYTLFEIFCFALIFVLALFAFYGDYDRDYCTVYVPLLSVYLYHFYVHF
jgi:hypothetical protein